MRNAFKLGYRCADGLLPAIMAMPENKKVYLLHYLKGLVITETTYRAYQAYQVNGITRYGEAAL